MRFGEGLAGLALLLGACTEPMFHERLIAPDGGPDDAGGVNPRPDQCSGSSCVDVDDIDADVIVPNPRLLPGWARPLVGKYAMRVRYYGHQQASELSTQVVALAKIEVDTMAQDVKLKTLLCEFTSELRDPASQGPVQRMSLIHPEYDPPRVYTVTFPPSEQPVWQASKAATNLGYAESVFGCTSGAIIDRRLSLQPWLSAPKCKCPTPDNKLPSELDDCRLTDPDVDREPGVALLLEGPVSGIDHVVRHDASEFVIGTVDPTEKRHRAKFKPIEQMAALQCSGRTCEKPPPISYCYIDYNDARFESIPDSEDFDCADILSEVKAGKLLAEPQVPTFPGGCRAM